MKQKIPNKDEIKSLHFNDITLELEYWLNFDKKQTTKLLFTECKKYNLNINNIQEFYKFFDENAFEWGETFDEILLNVVNEMQQKYNINIWND